MAGYTPTEYTAQVMDGIARRLADAGLGTYRPDGSAYQAGERRIVFDYSPPAPGTKQTEVLLITPYLPQSGALAVEHTRIQLRGWHVGRHPLEVRDWLDKVRAQFPANTVLEIGGHTFDRVGQTGSTTWGEPDRIGVLETSQNITLRGNRYAS